MHHGEEGKKNTSRMPDTEQGKEEGCCCCCCCCCCTGDWLDVRYSRRSPKAKEEEEEERREKKKMRWLNPRRSWSEPLLFLVGRSVGRLDISVYWVSHDTWLIGE
jgi:hypothetical protein